MKVIINSPFVYKKSEVETILHSQRTGVCGTDGASLGVASADAALRLFPPLGGLRSVMIGIGRGRKNKSIFRFCWKERTDIDETGAR